MAATPLSFSNSVPVNPVLRNDPLTSGRTCASTDRVLNTGSQLWGESIPRLPLATALERRYPSNPFCTEKYIRARMSLDETPIVFGDDFPVLGFSKRGKMSVSVDIPTLPSAEAAIFVHSRGHALFRMMGFDRVELSTLAAPELSVNFPGAVQRIEHCWNLTELSEKQLSTSHRRNVRKGAVSGLKVRRSTDPADSRVLLEQLSQSFDR